MRLIFKNANGKERLVADVESEQQATKKIKEFCNERDFKIPYMRTWEKNDRTWIDCGSHSEFFIIEK